MWIGIGLISLVAVFLLLSCIPVELTARFEVHKKPGLKMRLKWFFGWFSKELTGEKRPKKAVEVSRKRRIFSVKSFFRILRITSIKGLWRQFGNLLFDIIYDLKFKGLKADFKVGFKDPALTGFLFAILSPAAYFTNTFSPWKVNVQPSFEGKTSCEGYLKGTVRLRPVQLYGSILRFVWSKAALRMIREVVSKRWRR